MSMKDIDKDMEMGYSESLGNSSRVRVSSPSKETPMMVVRNNNINNNVNKNVNIFRGTLRECLKNHAINNGGHALGGCCEFLPTGPEGSLDALKCAACNCHRNFHRKEASLPPNFITVAAPIPATIIPTGDAYPPYITHHQQAAPPPQYTVYSGPEGLLHVTPPSNGGGLSTLAHVSLAGGGGGREDHDDAMDLDNGGIGSSSNSKKRFRTKFTLEQRKNEGFCRKIGLEDSET